MILTRKVMALNVSEKQLKQWQAKKVDDSSLSEWEAFALDFFHKKEYINDPWLQLTIRLDITKARDNYLKNFKPTKHASFTAWLTWSLVKAMDDHPWSRSRKVDGEWYYFDNLPLFFPVAVGGSKRFFEPVIYDAAISSWEDFCKNWNNAVKGENPNKLDHAIWSLAHFIGNLPNLDFTSFTLHKGTDETARPFFYFGQRTANGERYTIPLSINFDHSNADPFVINQLIESYKVILEG